MIDDYNDSFSDLVIMAITSQREKILSLGECVIEDWQAAGLLKPSVIKTAISTIEQRLVLKKLGRLSDYNIEIMNKTLKIFLNL